MKVIASFFRTHQFIEGNGAQIRALPMSIRLSEFNMRYAGDNVKVIFAVIIIAQSGTRFIKHLIKFNLELVFYEQQRTFSIPLVFKDRFFF